MKQESFQLMLIRREWSWKFEGKVSSMAMASVLTSEPQHFASTENLLNACGRNLT